MITASSVSREYSRASCACWMAASESVASSPASNAVARGTPARGSRSTMAATVSVLASAGSKRMLVAERSTFCTTHRSVG